MADQQLIDYIQKARQANQSDEQSRALLYQNGWTEAEVRDAFSSMDPLKPQPQPIAQPQMQPRPQIQPQVQPQAQPSYQPKAANSAMPPIERKKSHFFLKLGVVLIILLIIGGASYLVLGQQSLLKNIFSFASPKAAYVAPKANAVAAAPVVAAGLSTQKIVSLSQDYDVTNLTVAAFSKSGNEVAYCVPKLVGGQISCFLNDQLLPNAYAYKPYWIGISPDGKQVEFLYYDVAQKQYFTYENGTEGIRYDGPIVSPKFSDDSKSFTYVVEGKDGKSFAVLNGVNYPSHDRIYGIPALSSDGKYLIYGARDGQDFSWVADLVP